METESSMHILVVEDNVDIGMAIRNRLSRLGHAVDLKADGLAAYRLLRAEPFDAVILDVMLPSMDGFEILRAMRSEGIATPTLLLTARSTIADRVTGLDIGADDYLVKPFDYRELEARVMALLRRHSGQISHTLQLADLTIDRANRLVEVRGEALSLSRKEFALLEILTSRPKRLFSKDELLKQLFTFDQEPSPNAVEQYVTRLRKKLLGSGAEIRTERGLGYQIVSA